MKTPLGHDKIWYLSKCRVFEKLSREEIGTLTKNEMFTVRRGQIIEWRKNPEDIIYVVKKGAVKIVAREEGSSRETILAILGHGELFGQMPHLATDTRPVSAIALEDALVCEFDARDIERAMAEHPEMAQRVTTMIGDRLRRLETRVSQLLFKDARQRVSYVLLDLLKEWGESHAEGGMLLKVRITHQDIANLAGLTRETVSVVLAEFECDELLRTQGRKIIVLREDLLANLRDGKASSAA